MLDWPVRTGSGAEITRPALPHGQDQAAPKAARRTRGLGLAGRVLIITLGFVLLAMGLFYVTRLAARHLVVLGVEAAHVPAGHRYRS